MLDQLAGAGWLDRDEDGRVSGAAGLSLTTGPHRIALEGHDIRTWCAFDSIGIAAALGADATIRTDCAVCGTAIALETHAGLRRPTGRSDCGSPRVEPTSAATSATRRCSCARPDMPPSGPSGRAAMAAPST